MQKIRSAAPFNTAAAPLADYLNTVEMTVRLYEQRVVNELNAQGIEMSGAIAMMIWRMGRHLATGAKLGISDVKNLGYYVGSNVTYNIKLVESQGLIEKTSGVDRRRQYLQLTDEGQRICTAVDAIVQQLERNIPHVIDDAASDHVRHGAEPMRRISAALQGQVFVIR